ncbi:MAG: sulfotransferase domain-containing protein [Anaerolineales bacterium]|nr:sulfotransferase domain-containing protein [Anaerolineales bacterium]
MTTTKQPTFLVVGAAKSGTTSLFYYLAQHPEIYVPAVKEVNYFCEPRGPYAKADAEYLALFRWGAQKAGGEASVAYLFDEGAPQRIKQLLGAIKILIVLRNPADRAYSQWSFYNYRGEEPLGFEEALAAEQDRRNSAEFQANAHGHPGFFYYYWAGLYYEQVKHYIDTFGRENVHIDIFEELVRDLPARCANIFTLLGVDPDFQPNFTVYNEQQTYKNKWLKEMLSTARPGFVNKTYEALPVALRMRVFQVARKVYWSNMKEAPKRQMDPKVRERLLEAYQDDISQLSDLLGCDLSAIWLAPKPVAQLAGQQ